MEEESANPPKLPLQPPIETTTTLIKLQQQQQQDEDDIPSLSPFALAALQDYLSSQSLQNQPKQQDANANVDDAKLMPLLKEDWRLSQFWYSPHTATTLANEINTLFHNCTDTDTPPPRVACISCPTLFIYLKKLYPTMSAQLLEYDERFEQYGSDFTFYDYNLPEDLPQAMKHAYQIVVADPPYLSEECLKKVAQTVLFLAQPGKNFVLLLSGAVQRERAAKFLGLHPCGFRPEHSSKLGNEFHLYTNYDPGERLGGWVLED